MQTASLQMTFFYRSTLSTLFITILSSGCFFSTPTPTSLPTEVPVTSLFEETGPTKPEPPPAQAGATNPAPSVIYEQCTNRFYPVHNGSWWMYNQQAGNSLTHTMTVRNDNSFSIKVQTEGITFNFNGLCIKDGVVLFNVPGMAASLLQEAESSTLTAQNMNGLTLPNNVNTGDTWSQQFTLNGEGINAVIETDYKAVGYDTVNLPVGSFTALKLGQIGHGIISGESYTTQTTLWYAQDVGIVKMVNTLLGKTFSFEMLAYNFP